MNLRIVLLLSVVLTAVALTMAACSSAASPPLATPAIVETAPSLSPTTVTLPTIASTSTPVPTTTTAPTILPTATPSPTTPPTAVPSSTPRPTQTPIPSATPEPTATLDTQSAFEAIAPPSNLGSYPSPDGSTVAEVFRYECALLPPPEGDGEPYEQAYELIQLTVSDGEPVVFADQPQSCGGLGAAGLEGYLWSGDGRYFYYGTAREGGPDGCGFFAPPYYRLDTADMTTTYLGYGQITPDGTMLALWSPDEMLVVYTVNGEELARLPASGNNRVQNTIAWSPDGLSLVFVRTSEYCPEGASTLTRLDLASGESVVLREDNPGYAHVQWLDNERLELGNIIGDATLVIRAADGQPAP